MHIRTFIFLLIFLSAFGCNEKDAADQTTDSNSLLTPFKLPPFDAVRDQDYMPAFKTAMQIHNSEINQIVNNSKDATFENTIAVFDTCGLVLNRIEGMFKAEIGTSVDYNKIQILEEIFPLITKHRGSIYQNDLLFKRIGHVYKNRDNVGLNKEESYLLETIYKKFIRGGAKLNSEQKKKLVDINAELSSLRVRFLDNLNNDNEDFKKIIFDSTKLNGLPNSFIQNAEMSVSKNGNKKAFQISLNQNNYYTVLQFAQNRTLREDMYDAYSKQGNNNNDFDNKAVVNQIINLRLKKAKLFAYDDYSKLIFGTENRLFRYNEILRFLDNESNQYFERLKDNTEVLQKLIYEDGYTFKLKPWDWLYYSEVYRQKLININREELSAYFELENTLSGLFLIINNLFGIRIIERTDIAVFEKGVRTFEFEDSKGNHTGILYVSFYAGHSDTDYIKRQYYKDKKRVDPVLIANFDFEKNFKKGQTFLSLYQTKVLFHEFGHALHGLISDTEYYTNSGLNVASDFVEFPSQYLENYALHKQSLKQYAKHYKTGAIIPDELIEGIANFEEFNKAFSMSERIAVAYLDMSLHSIVEEKDYDIDLFETKLMDRIQFPKEISPRYRSTYFRHIFSGNYASGIYGYVMTNAGVEDIIHIDNSENIFDKETAGNFYNTILKKGGSLSADSIFKSLIYLNESKNKR